MTNRSHMSLIIGLVGPQRPELFAFEAGKNAAFNFFYSLHLQMLTDQHQTWSEYIYYHKISDEFDYGSNQITSVFSAWYSRERCRTITILLLFPCFREKFQVNCRSYSATCITVICIVVEKRSCCIISV